MWTYVKVLGHALVLPELLADASQVELGLDLDLIGVPERGSLSDLHLIHEELAPLLGPREPHSVPLAVIVGVVGDYVTRA